jgi:hypothetical protein
VSYRIAHEVSDAVKRRGIWSGKLCHCWVMFQSTLLTRDDNALNLQQSLSRTWSRTRFSTTWMLLPFNRHPVKLSTETLPYAE